MSSKPKRKGVQTIFWWITWITLTIVSFFVAAAIWTPIIANKFGSVHESNAAIFWVIAVFGTWMVFLVPMIVFMYQKVDKAYEDARINREKKALEFRSIELDPADRRLSPELEKKLEGVPEAIQGGHIVKVKLQDGREFKHVFIQNRNDVLGIYDQKELTFVAKDIIDIIPMDTNKLPAYQQNRWLRLDGVTLPQ